MRKNTKNNNNRNNENDRQSLNNGKTFLAEIEEKIRFLKYIRICNASHLRNRTDRYLLIFFFFLMRKGRKILHGTYRTLASV